MNMTSGGYENLVCAMFFTLLLSFFLDGKPIEKVEHQSFVAVDPVKMCKKSKECKKLAEVLVWEARGEPDEGKIAVANVVVNRVNHPSRWGGDIFSVVNENKQFSYLKDMHVQKQPSERDWEKAKKIAFEVMNKQVYNPVGNALFYHSVNIKPPRWTKVMQIHSVIGGHIFYTCTSKC